MFKSFQEDMDRGFEIITERVHSADERIEEANDKMVYMAKVKTRAKAQQAAMAENTLNIEVKPANVVEQEVSAQPVVKSGVSATT